MAKGLVDFLTEIARMRYDGEGLNSPTIGDASVVVSNEDAAETLGRLIREARALLALLPPAMQEDAFEVRGLTASADSFLVLSEKTGDPVASIAVPDDSSCAHCVKTLELSPSGDLVCRNQSCFLAQAIV